MIRIRRHRRSSDPRDRGMGYVETVVAVALLGVMVVPLFDAVMTGITSSSRNRVGARVETALQDAADRINRAPMGCDYTPYVIAAVQAQGWSPSAVTIEHSRFSPGPSPTVGGSWLDDACGPSATPRPDEVQRVTMRMLSPDGKFTRSLQVVKSSV